MEVFSNEIFSILKILLPGFLTAAIFYGVTHFPKRSEFEAVVTALIFTTVIQTVLVPVRWSLFWIGGFWHIGTWSADVELVWLMLLAIGIGLLFSFLINNDYLFSLLRTLNITKQTSHPSEWYSVFSKSENFVILNMVGERRLHGWPIQWPNDPKSGHFVMEQPAWLDDDGSFIHLSSTKYLVVPVTDVESVEIMEPVVQREEEVDGSRHAETAGRSDEGSESTSTGETSERSNTAFTNSATEVQDPTAGTTEEVKVGA